MNGPDSNWDANFEWRNLRNSAKIQIRRSSSDTEIRNRHGFGKRERERERVGAIKFSFLGFEDDEEFYTARKNKNFPF